MPHYAIGDVQGCYDQLRQLLDVIQYDDKSDQLIFLGDLINRGPNSLETLRFVSSQPNCISVLGNHDLHALACYYTQKKLKKNDTLSALFTALDCHELMEWLRQQPLLYSNPTLQCVFVHAGIPPCWDLKTANKLSQEITHWLQGHHALSLLGGIYHNKPSVWDPQLSDIKRARYIINALTRMRFCDEHGALVLSEKGGLEVKSAKLIPWFSFPNRKHIKEKIFFGHWAALNGNCPTENIEALDTGCVWGNTLTAYCIETNQRFSVKNQLPL